MASRADPRVGPLLSPWLAQGRSHRRGRGRCPHRPQEPRLCRDRGIPLQNGLYAAAAGAILYAIFETSRQISTGPSSGLAAVAASAVAVAGITGIRMQPPSWLMPSSRVRCTWSLPCSRWDGSRSSSPGRSSPASSSAPHRRRHQPTSQAHGDGGDRLEPTLQELWSWLGTGRRPAGDRARWRSRPRGRLRIASRRATRPRCLVLVVGVSWRRGSSISTPAVSPSLARCLEELPTLQLPEGQLLADHPSTVAIAAVALVLIGFSQTAGDARAFAASTAIASTSTRSRSLRAWPMSAPGCSRECRSRPVCRRAR